MINLFTHINFRDLARVFSLRASTTILKITFLLAVLALYGCGKTEVKEVVEYTGPIQQVEKMEMYYSESDQIKIKMKADLVYEFQNGDREFPKGLYLEFFNEFGRLESILKANNAFFFKEENKWRGRGNVEVKNVEKSEQLNTEELFWKPAEKKIFTESFVTIRQQGDVIYGKGLDAKQDLSDYTITQPYGDFEVKEE
ncbi:MAG TPA: LPS export ABC transporter periplasmic protein LptC [Cyclobacteriaceae bacterium]|nr:LPS export ABC transporter periplasmic protein LptC [Cyclobacteriaceae bacterium]